MNTWLLDDDEVDCRVKWTWSLSEKEIHPEKQKETNKTPQTKQAKSPNKNNQPNKNPNKNNNPKQQQQQNHNKWSIAWQYNQQQKCKESACLTGYTSGSESILNPLIIFILNLEGT